MLVLVTGGTGAIGARLANALVREGYQVRIMARRPAPNGLLPQSVEVLYGDIREPSDMERAVAGTEAIFHLAAKLHVPNPAPSLRAEYQQINVDGTRLLVEAAQSADVRRIVLFSTVSVYGPTGRQPIDETETPRPDTIYGLTKLQAEEIALAARNSNGEPLSVVLRMASVYGPRMKGNYVTLVNALARGRFLPVGSGNNMRTLVYDEDAARAAILAARHPLAAGRTYNVSDGSVHSLRDIIVAISQGLGRRPPIGCIPLGVARLAALVADTASGAFGQRRSWVASVDKLVESSAVRADRIQQELGFRPEYDLKQGWGKTIRDWGVETHIPGRTW